jgi:lactoylglutathione lyase
MKSDGIVWAGLSVEDLKAALAFYGEILGLPLRRSGEGWAHFEAGGGALFEVMAGGRASRTPKSVEQQPLVIGFLVEDLEQVVAELTDRGVNFLGGIESFKNQSWAHFCDPEGNRLEIKEIRRKS